ncbi:MAG: DUF3109 family protein [Prolixibacteraceae bacterium]|nr:DUF3109 family protein [Prolixibacteraceae bacterium]
MVEIGRTIISLDVFKKHFLCDLKVCKGACCIEGDSGAPLTDEEAALVEKYYPVFKKYMPQKHIAEVEKQGYSVIDSDGDLVTPLYNKRECAYTYTSEEGILSCAIEKAFLNGEVDFRKPVSCHLFPIRISHYNDFDAVNYQQLDICRPGRECGAKKGLPLYKFLKEPLIRMYGEEWYRELEVAAEYLANQSK